MLRLISYVLIFVAGFAACAGIYMTHPAGTVSQQVPALTAAPAPTSSPSTTATPGATTPAAIAPIGPGTTIYAVSRLEPSVVNIDITGKPQPAPEAQGQFGFPFGIPGFGDTPQGEMVPRGEASGVIISSDGYILTNNHVAGDASTIQVTLHDGRRFKAHVVGLDPKSDLAVIKVNATGLPAAAIGNSADVKVGQEVIAVGNPLGIGSTATHGIISAIRSPFNIKDHIFPQILQTDAAINPGNSGGALADMNGAVIGINTAIASTSGGNIGIGFSIPINLAMQHAQELIKTHSVSYPWLGVAYGAQQPDQPVAVPGAVVRQVLPGSPAAVAGIQSGDIITRINDRNIDEPEKLNFLIGQHKPGEKVTVTIWRNGQIRTLDVTLGKAPDNLTQTQAPSEQETQPEQP
jgi:serine protease Do